MRRTILLAGALPFVSAFLGGALALTLGIPTIGRAQETHLNAESLTIVGDGTDRLRLTTRWDGRASDFSLLAPDGTTRLIISSGGIAAVDSAGSGMNIYTEDGTQVARLGTGRGPAGNQPVTTSLILSDQRGQRRIHLSVDEGGRPSILMFDADGTVTWSAP